MTNNLREVAESRFAALTRKDDAAMTAVDEQQQAVREKTERLRALRLAHQAQTTADHAAILEAKRRARTAA